MSIKKSSSKPKQLELFPVPELEHGGSTRPKKRKTLRPLDPKRSVHLVMRATQAQGPWSMLKPASQLYIRHLLTRLSRRYGIRVYKFANVGNHLHLLIKAPSRKAFQAFLRHFAGSIALRITRAVKGNGLKKRFWDALAYTRVVNWGREFRAVSNYLVLNLFESVGLLNRKQEPTNRVRGILVMAT